MKNKPVLIYDEQCPLCKRFKQGLELLDTQKRIEFRDANDEKIYQEFSQLDQQDCLNVAHLILASGELVTGGDIIVELSKTYPGIQKFAWLIESDMGKKVNDFFYKKAEQLRKKSLEGCSGCGKR